MFRKAVKEIDDVPPGPVKVDTWPAELTGLAMLQSGRSDQSGPSVQGSEGWSPSHTTNDASNLCDGGKGVWDWFFPDDPRPQDVVSAALAALVPPVNTVLLPPLLPC